MNNDNKWVKEFDTCPGCGGENRFFESIVKEMKDRGIVPNDFNFYLDMKTGPVITQQILQKLPIGSEIPAFSFATDICADCGCIYVIRLERTTAKKSLTPVQFQPSRQQRRASLKGGQGLQLPGNMNNPAFS